MSETGALWTKNAYYNALLTMSSRRPCFLWINISPRERTSEFRRHWRAKRMASLASQRCSPCEFSRTHLTGELLFQRSTAIWCSCLLLMSSQVFSDVFAAASAATAAAVSSPTKQSSRPMKRVERLRSALQPVARSLARLCALD